MEPKGIYPQETQQALKITIACSTEGWGMRVVSEYEGKKIRGRGQKSRKPRKGRKREFLTPI